MEIIIVTISHSFVMKSSAGETWKQLLRSNEKAFKRNSNRNKILKLKNA